MVKQVAIVALDPRASAFYGNQVQELFGDYVKVRSYSVMEGTISNMVRADLYMMSTDAFDNREEVPQYIPIDAQISEIHVTYMWETIRRLRTIPAGTKALFVNMTETMAREAIAQLEQFGITHIHWIPFYPGASLEEDVHIAVTPDEMRYVPPKMETVIDIGQRVCTSGMMIEIALRLGLESLLEGPAFQEYARSVATSNYSFDQMFARSVRLESLFHILLESLEDGVIGINEKGEIFACSRQAEDMTCVSAAGKTSPARR